MGISARKDLGVVIEKALEDVTRNKRERKVNFISIILDACDFTLDIVSLV